MKDIDYKVPGGKLIRLQAGIKDGKIASARINGDFFVHPESSIAALEDALAGKKLEKSSLLTVVDKKLKGATLVGITPEAIVHALLMLR